MSSNLGHKVISAHALAVKDLSFAFSKQKVALSKINFAVQPGEVFALVGHNGAGKTTLFHLILGFKFYHQGSIRIFDTEVTHSDSRSRLGYIPERAYLPMDRSLRDYLTYLSRLQSLNLKAAMLQIATLLKELNLDQAADQPMRSFSKGMLQKAMIAQAMLGDPELIILDEPMSGLDPEARDQLRSRIHGWKAQGKSVLFSSHAFDDVESLADRVLVLDQGDQTFLGTVEAWKAARK